MKQKGFAPVLILVILAVIIGVGAVSYGIYVASNITKPPAKVAIPIMENASLHQTVRVGSPECPEVDYTGCDTSGDFMTWTDDGIRTPTDSPTK